LAGKGKPASSAAIEVQEASYQNKALTFKRPAKRKISMEEVTIELVTVIPYSSLFKDDEDIILGHLSEAGGLLSRLDQSCLSMNYTLPSFIKDYTLQQNKAHVESMTGLLGSRLVVLPTQY
jgi:hypothetical protein